MKTSVAAIVLGFLISAVLTPLARRWTLARGLVDVPKEARRLHSTPIPRTGGLAIAAGILAPILGLAIYENLISQLIYRDRLGIVTLFAGALLALGVGLIDDLYKVSARYRLLALFGIAALEWFGGHRIEVVTLPFAGEIHLGWLSFAMTCLWIVGMMVAFNFIDGLDGLAAGIALIGTATMLVMGFAEGNVLWMTWSGAMVGALLGFLCFNFNPASIFMGDSGSNLLGFLVALVSMETSRKQQTTVALVVPMLALGLPILDAALTIVRRWLLREGLFLSDRGHIYHRLLDLGLSQRRVALVLYACALVLSVAGLAFALEAPVLSVSASVLIAAVVFGIMFVTGYVRLEDLRLMYRRGLKNVARIRALETAVHATAKTIPYDQPLCERVRWALARVVQEAGISGASCVEPDGRRFTIGDFDECAKGVWASLQIVAGGEALALSFLWRDRTSGPSTAEVTALRCLAASLAGAAGSNYPPRSGRAGKSSPGSGSLTAHVR